MNIAELSAEQIVQRLEALVEAETEHAVAFDGDGTLWNDDVGEIVFEYAVSRELVRDEALAELRDEARRFGLDANAGASATARTLYTSYKRGVYPEERVCEMMTWCYAGMSEPEFIALAEEALEAADFASKLNQRIVPLVQWARDQGYRALVISASPTLIVRPAARMLGFEHRDVLGALAATRDGVIAPAMHEPVPYGPGKVEAGRRAMGPARWLASCGDSLFDLDMMRAACLAVGVRPKPELRQALAELTRAVVLDSDG